MEKVKKKLKEEVMCGLARTNCVALLKTRHLLDIDMISDTCKYVSTLCKKFEDPKCQSQSETCYQASLALREGEEEKYLELCQKAAQSCPYNEKYEKMVQEAREAMEPLGKEEDQKRRTKTPNFYR